MKMNALKTLPLTLLVAMMLVGAGCENSAKGLEKDTEQNAQGVSKATDKAIDGATGAASNAGEGVSDAAANVGAATILTPRLKNAVTADAQLNERRNLINIDSTDETVTIRGHVMNQELKAHAEDVVKKEMKQAEAKQRVINELEIVAAP